MTDPNIPAHTNSSTDLDGAPKGSTETETVTAAPLDPEIAALLETGFDKEGAEGLKMATDANPVVADKMKTSLEPDSLAQRVALNATLFDNTPSMRTLIRLAAGAHDKSLETIERVTKDEPVDVLATALWLNAYPGDAAGVIYPYTPVAAAPRLASRVIELHGMTAWYDRYADLLAGTAAQAAELETHNKTVYGMAGLVTDGFDNDSRVQDPATLAKIVRSYRRLKTFVPYAIYVGAMPAPGSQDYNVEVSVTKRRLRDMDVDTFDPELAGASLETLVRRIFTTCGFDPKMVFMPGQDMREIVAAFVTVSKLMASVSQGQMPEGLTEI